MKKNIALALLTGAVATLPLSAQADVADHVTIYGKVHGSVDYVDDGDDGDFYTNSNTSRLGFKGSEELSDDLSLIWQYESQVNIDETGKDFASRNSFIGLSHKAAGTVLAGRHDTPFKLVGRKVDMFGDRVGDSRNIIGALGAGWDLRLNNVVAYKSPDLGGAHALLAYSTDDGVDDSDAASGYLMFNDQGLLFALSGEWHGKGITGGSPESEMGGRAVAGFKNEFFQVGALYQILKDTSGVDGADSNSWGIGAAFSAEPFTFRTQYYGTDGVDGLDDSGADMFAVGIDNALSANTTLYLVGATTLNDKAASYTVTGGGHGDKVSPYMAGEDTLAISVGLIHVF